MAGSAVWIVDIRWLKKERTKPHSASPSLCGTRDEKRPRFVIILEIIECYKVFRNHPYIQPIPDQYDPVSNISKKYWLDVIPFAGDMDFFRLGASTPNSLGGARGHPGHPIKTPVSHTHLSTTPKTIYRV
jgi:hypothetical protein